MSSDPVKAWICPICGYIHYGETPPDECPICGAEGASFEAYTEAEAAPAAAASQAETIVIAGAGIAGVSAAEAIRKVNGEVRVILVSEEHELPYYRVNLTRYLAGSVKAEDLPLHPAEWYPDHSIELKTGCRVTGMDLQNKQVMLDGCDTLGYDRLILATGARAFRPPIPGMELRNAATLRTRADADMILSAAQEGMRCVCIGGGILGLETAAALARCGLDVTVLEALSWLMPRQLNQQAARVFAGRVEGLGITLRTGVQVQALEGEGSVSGVRLEGGEVLPADLVIISAGVRPQVELARAAGLEVKLGIVVDDRMQTSDPAVYAVGDAAEHRGVLYGTWMPAQLQGSIAGTSAVKQQAAFPGVPRANTLKVLGFDLFSIGAIAPETPADRLVEEAANGDYRGFVLRGDCLAGAILLGDASLAPAIRKAIEGQVLLGGETSTAGLVSRLQALG